MGWSKQHQQQINEEVCQGCSLIEHNLDNLSQGIQDEKPTNMEDIAYLAQQINHKKENERSLRQGSNQLDSP